MSEQDAPDSDDAAESAADGEESVDPTERAPGDADLEEIAEEPEGEPGGMLEEMLPADDLEGVDAGETLVDHVAETAPETVASELAALGERVEQLTERLEEREAELEDLESRLSRKQADFQNYKKRQKERLEEEKQRATEDMVRRLLDVRDNLERALDQDEDADIRSGVESTLRQFDEQLARENVEPIEPDPGDETDPRRHETLATIAAEYPDGAIARIHRPGYEMAGKVLRPAQVAVSDGSQSEETSTGDEGSSNSDEEPDHGAAEEDDPGGDESAEEE